MKGGATTPAVVQREGCVEVNAYWKHWPCLFPQHGPGPKHLRRIELRSWQRGVVAAHPGSLLRGLIHSDGWRGVNTVVVRGRTYEYPRYQFVSYSKDIQAIFRDACRTFGIGCRQMRWNSISVARRGDVAKLDRVVGLKT